MIVRSVGLAAAACLVLAAEAIMIPSTVSMPGLTVDSLSRKEGNTDSEGEIVEALPIDSDLLEKLKDLHLGVSKPMPFSDDEDDLFWIQANDEVDDEDMEDDEDYDDDEEAVGYVTFIPTDTEEAETDEDEVPKHHEMVSNDCPSGNSLAAAICRFRNLVSSQIDHVKPYVTHHRRPCPKKLAAMAKAKVEEIQPPHIHGGVNKFWPHFHPDTPLPPKNIWHGGHYFNEGSPNHSTTGSRFHRVLHAFCHGLRRFVTGFVVPVLIGVAAGMTASLVGMCVGTLLAWLWIKFVRGNKRGNAGAIVIEEVDVIPAEKEGLLEAQPASEDAPPVYVEKE